MIYKDVLHALHKHVSTLLEILPGNGTGPGGEGRHIVSTLLEILQWAITSTALKTA